MELCGVEMDVGDYVEVQYSNGKKFKGAILKGNITKLWDAPRKQGEVNNGWCFHDHDQVLHNKKAVLGKGGVMDEIIKMLKKYEPDFREMDHGEILTIVAVLNAFLSDYRTLGWDDVAIGYGE